MADKEIKPKGRWAKKRASKKKIFLNQVIERQVACVYKTC